MRKARGFSLVEVGVGLAIVSALAAISILALRGLKQRGDYAGATGDVVTGLRLARSESFGRGQATYFIIDTTAATGVRWWSLLDVGGNFDIIAWDPANPTGLGDRLLASGTLPPAVTVGTVDNTYPQQLPQPYQLVPSAVSPVASPLGCSFCLTSGARSGYGWVRFSPGSPPNATFPAGTTASTVGQELTLMFQSDLTSRMMVIAILARSGAVSNFEQIE